jgi:hypothetical protein
MATVGLFFRFQARPGREEDVATFLATELPQVLDDVPGGTILTMRFTSEAFGIVASFPDREGERTSVGARIAQALRTREHDLETAPALEGFDVLATSLVPV